MVKKILFCASRASHIINFHLPYLKEFQNKGYEVWVLTNEKEKIPYADHVVAMPFCKKMTSPENIKTIFKIKKFLKREKFTAVSTHTTLASAVLRAAILLLREKPIVFYTVHGYLFHEEDGIKKWIYLLPEKICAHITQTMMVMNREDYEIACAHKLYRKNLYYIDGMGLDLSRFVLPSKEERNRLRAEQGFSENDFLFIYAAEFSKRKNQKLLIRAFSELCKKKDYVYLLLAGTGSLLEECKQYAAQLGLQNRVRFLGYVNQIHKLYPLCDATVSSSHIEGLPFNVMEAMACGLPAVVSDIKGHKELVEQGKNGILYPVGRIEDLIAGMEKICEDKQLQRLFGQESLKKVKQFSIQQVFMPIMKIYEQGLSEKGTV